MTSPTEAVEQPNRGRLWTPGFIILCLVALFGFAHHSLLLPTVPLFVDDKGGSGLLAGLALLTFSIPSFVIRPFLGYLTDTWSAVGVLVLGLVLLALGGVLYLTGFLALIFVAAVLRGIGWGGLNTGAYTILARVAPDTRRGEASGYYSSATSSAVILFPAVAIWLIDSPGLGFNAVFLLAVGFVIAGVVLSQLVLSRVVEQPANATPPLKLTPLQMLAMAGSVDRTVLPATLISLTTNLAFPAITAFLPLYARDLEVSNIGIVYLVAGASSILVRPMIGSLSDMLGRSVMLVAGFGLQAVGFVFIFLANDLLMILIGAFIATMGNAVNIAVTTALAMDLANPAQRGRAMATFSISFQVGQGFGAMMAGALADLAGYRSMYAGSLAMVGLGLLIMALTRRRLRVAITDPVNE